ncbi:hypothetical protein EDB87DRAFT_1553257 [Lactarius vividus]|nr:hypothetical protein EDB87DRAFT_1553257 [Lactarius vividus]
MNVDESHTPTGVSDKEIYQAVMNAKEAHENLDINGGDDIDDDTPLEPRPTQADILKAVSLISKYTNNINSPLARSVEAILGSFNRFLRLNETQNMKETVITDYFSKL